MNSSQGVFTVSSLNAKIRENVKCNWNNMVTLHGEISNCKVSRGHLFMTLKDTTSSVSVICWSFSRKFPNTLIDNGKKLVVGGYLDFNPKGGSFYLNSCSFKVEGVGDLHLEYLNREKKFRSLGYFDKNKKSFPKNLTKVGILTAVTGAAIKDVMFMLKKYNFKGKLFIKDIKVQGPECPSMVVNGLKLLDKLDLDLIVLTRGGGNFEHLFGFSHPKVVEQIYKTKTCVLSAIGHEVDTMLSDLVADKRAPTPSIAGEMISTHQKRYFDSLTDETLIESLWNDVDRELGSVRLKLANMKLEPIAHNIEKWNHENELVLHTLETSIKNELSLKRTKIANLCVSLISPLPVFDQGFALLMIDGKLVTTIKDLIGANTVTVKLADGEITLNVSL